MTKKINFNIQCIHTRYTLHTQTNEYLHVFNDDSSVKNRIPFALHITSEFVSCIVLVNWSWSLKMMMTKTAVMDQNVWQNKGKCYNERYSPCQWNVPEENTSDVFKRMGNEHRVSDIEVLLIQTINERCAIRTSTVTDSKEYAFFYSWVLTDWWSPRTFRIWIFCALFTAIHC